MVGPTMTSMDATRAHARLLAAAPVAERRVEAAGISTAVHEGGDGPPIVLLHGQGEYWAVWLAVLDDLVATNRVVVVDLPGHGRSSRGQQRLGAGTLVPWLDEVIAATCASAPVLVGHLLGGAIAARYAVEHGDRLRHLVLVDTLGLTWFRPKARFAIPMVRFMARPTRDSRDRLFEQCFVDADRTGRNYGSAWDDLRDVALDRAQGPDLDPALRSMMPRVGVPPVPEGDLDQLTTPTTVIHGRDDLQVSLRSVERAAGRHGWPLHVIEDCRDDPAAEQPAAFLEVLRAAIESPTDQTTEGRS